MEKYRNFRPKEAGRSDLPRAILPGRNSFRLGIPSASGKARHGRTRSPPLSLSFQNPLLLPIKVTHPPPLRSKVQRSKHNTSLSRSPLSFAMEKLLAMSILSSGPDFSGDGKANGWFNRGWMGGKKNKQEENKSGSDKSGTLPVLAKKMEQQQKSKSAARFAVELDGLHCFETIVPQ